MAKDSPAVPEQRSLEGLSYSELMAQAGDEMVTVESPTVIDKAKLVGVPFVIIRWRWNEGKGAGGQFVSLEVATSEPVETEHGPVEEGIVNDGSTGIAEQIRKLESKGINGMVNCPKGLRRSDYVHETHGPATTFYLA